MANLTLELSIFRMCMVSTYISIYVHDYYVGLSLPYTAEDDPPPDSPITVVYSMIGVGVVLVAMSVLIVLILIGKRKRVTAKLWRPTSPSDTATSGEASGASQSGNSVMATDSSL